MEITKRAGFRIAVFGTLAVILPLFVFPRQFGTELAKGSLINAMIELLFYGFLMFLFNRRASLMQLAQVSGVCLIFRLVLGAVFGLFAATIYSMDFLISLQLGLSSYLPAILFHIVVTPLVLWPVISPLAEYRPKRKVIVQPESTESRSLDAGATSIAISKEHGIVSDAQVPSASPEEQPKSAVERLSEETAPAAPVAVADINGFDRATGYIGEHGSVHLAVVADHEGLILSSFQRGQDADPEAWAPMSLLLFESNRQALSRVDSGLPEKLDLLAGKDRIVMARQNWYSLVVIAERQTDDFLNIRINQGLEIMRKYVEERYSKIEHHKAEMTYV